MNKLIPILYGLLALIHILPAMAVLAPARLSSLYGFDAGDSVLTTLLQHRALLFGILAAALIYAVFNASVRWPVLIGAVVSMGGFIVIAMMRGETGGALRTIVIADVIGLIIAALAAFLLWRAVG
ncbi:MAG: phosphopantetheine adenylyltransferase [Pseudomonadota bacterium]